ncbi:MAG: hypothetical protein DMG21_10335 [Acidobacteria bacterium]|nr:MAG: hypothetical protein DMG21_10335 [Acidobacteriota bacterium]
MDQAEAQAMTLEEKLRVMKNAAAKSAREQALDRELEYLRRREARAKQLPAERAPRGIEEYVEGQVERNEAGEFFLARQALPFGRPYGRLRIGDIAAANLEALDIFLGPSRNGAGARHGALTEAERLVFLDTETTGLAGGTGTVAFLIGVGKVEGSSFVVRQFFLRDYPEEKAALRALAELLVDAEGLVTFNGKTFDVPLLETRHTLARMKSPFPRLAHLDMLHPSRQMWKLRLESCALTDLERAVLGIAREGDVEGSEIPAIYFDYLRTGDPRGLAPVFYHNALDILTLAALAVELARVIEGARNGESTPASSLDLYSLSRIFRRTGEAEKSLATCEQALAFTEQALDTLRESSHPSSLFHRFNHRRQRLERKARLG